MIAFILYVLFFTVVGKTSLLMRYANNEFNSNTITTVGIDFKIKKVTQNGLKLKLQVKMIFIRQ